MFKRIEFKRIKYEELNARQKENFNFQKIASKLADYGYHCMWLNDDWQGADFIACHTDGNTFIKVQLKGRLTFDEKYKGKDIYVAFKENDQVYIYPHDELLSKLLPLGSWAGSKSWDKEGSYNWPSIPQNLAEHVQQHAI